MLRGCACVRVVESGAAESWSEIFPKSHVGTPQVKGFRRI